MLYDVVAVEQRGASTLDFFQCESSSILGSYPVKKKNISTTSEFGSLIHLNEWVGWGGGLFNREGEPRCFLPLKAIICHAQC